MKTNKKGNAIVLVAIVAASALTGGITGHLLTQPQITEVEVVKLVDNVIEVPVEVINEVEVKVPVNVTVEVEDEAFLKLVCDRALFDDLTECKKEITAEDVALKLAIDKVKQDFAREAERAGLIVDDRRADLVRVYDKFDQVEVVVSDYDRKEYEFVIEARVEDKREDARVDVQFTVTVDNGVARIVKAE